MRNTFKTWEYPARINSDNEKKMMIHKVRTNKSYNEIINDALKQYFDGIFKGHINPNDGGKI
jgi:hypothetical protein